MYQITKARMLLTTAVFAAAAGCVRGGRTRGARGTARASERGRRRRCADGRSARIVQAHRPSASGSDARSRVGRAQRRAAGLAGEREVLRRRDLRGPRARANPRGTHRRTGDQGRNPGRNPEMRTRPCRKKADRVGVGYNPNGYGPAAGRAAPAHQVPRRPSQQSLEGERHRGKTGRPPSRLHAGLGCACHAPPDEGARGPRRDAKARLERGYEGDSRSTNGGDLLVAEDPGSLKGDSGKVIVSGVQVSPNGIPSAFRCGGCRNGGWHESSSMTPSAASRCNFTRHDADTLGRQSMDRSLER